MPAGSGRNRAGADFTNDGDAAELASSMRCHHGHRSGGTKGIDARRGRDCRRRRLARCTARKPDP